MYIRLMVLIRCFVALILLSKQRCFDIIDILVKSKNYVVAVCIGIFSFIILCQALGLYLCLFPKFSSRRAQSILSLSANGVWLMYLLLAFLSYLSFSNMSPVDVAKTFLAIFLLYYSPYYGAF